MKQMWRWWVEKKSSVLLMMNARVHSWGWRDIFCQLENWSNNPRHLRPSSQFLFYITGSKTQMIKLTFLKESTVGDVLLQHWCQTFQKTQMTKLTFFKRVHCWWCAFAALMPDIPKNTNDKIDFFQKSSLLVMCFCSIDARHAGMFLVAVKNIISLRMSLTYFQITSLISS